MIRLLIATGVGYVFGARAGRERYEQLVNFTKSLQSNPLFAEAIASARKQAAGALGENPPPARGNGSAH